MRKRTPRVVWLFSMTRSGSSATAYASARALGWAVADEPFGPWDRTGKPYHLPAETVELHRAHLERDERLTPETCALAERVFATIAERERTDTVIVKMPHLMIDPRDVAERWPTHRTAWLLRNPLARLNSLHTRGWQDQMRTEHDLETARAFLARYLAQPRPKRFTFDQLTGTPRRFFRRMWRAWDADFSEEQIEIATRYRAQTYHESSRETIEGRNTHRVLSEHRRDVPAESAGAYANDPLVSAVLDRFGWDSAEYTEARA